jgi:hypothetical protein
MVVQQTITSAALYFKDHGVRSIPFEWLERARDLFTDYNLSPVFFSAAGGCFEYDDCFLLAEHGSKLTRFGETIRAGQSDLHHQLREGKIHYLGLDSTREGAEDRESWRAMVNIASSGEVFVGIEDELVSDPATLLKRAYNMAQDFVDIRYGVAYKMALEEHPDCFASGFAPSSASEVLDMIRYKDKSVQRSNSIELWRNELNGEKRHLDGLFRGAFPANILSDSHLRTAALPSRGIGRLSKLPNSRWLWELSDLEIQQAEKTLEFRGVLISQSL